MCYRACYIVFHHARPPRPKNHTLLNQFSVNTRIQMASLEHQPPPRNIFGHLCPEHPIGDFHSTGLYHVHEVNYLRWFLLEQFSERTIF